MYDDPDAGAYRSNPVEPGVLEPAVDLDVVVVERVPGRVEVEGVAHAPAMCRRAAR